MTYLHDTLIGYLIMLRHVGVFLKLVGIALLGLLPLLLIYWLWFHFVTHDWRSPQHHDRRTAFVMPVLFTIGSVVVPLAFSVWAHALGEQRRLRHETNRKPIVVDDDDGFGTIEKDGTTRTRHTSRR